LVLAPHPDDEIIGPGGTVALLCDNQRVVRTLIATDGGFLAVPDLEPAEVGELRRHDATRAARVLGAPPPVFLGFDDGSLPKSLTELSAAISVHVAEFRPDAIYVPWLLDAHADHQALAMALSLAVVPADTEIWGYEVWAAAPANRLVDVTSVWERKERALAEHRVPASVFDTTGHLALNRWRSIHGMGGTGQAEAFLALPFSSYEQLAEELRAETS
jgi:LmbE family N-acetylglucosaminyl deacetylase